MSGSGQTAEIIRFPLRPQAAVRLDEGQERLRRALATLDHAIADQRVAVATWRKAIGELGSVVSGLGDSLQRYRGNLDKLGERVAGLHGQAVRLEKLAESVQAAPRD